MKKSKKQLWLKPETHKSLKIRAVQEEMTMEEFLDEMLKKTKRMKVKGNDEFFF